MPHLISLTPEQLRAIVQWTEPAGAEIRLDEGGTGEPGLLIVGQGESRCRIQPDGTIEEW